MTHGSCKAIADSRKARTLDAVIGSADYINVDIPSCRLLVKTVNRLIAAGLVETDGEKLGATKDGRRLVRRASKQVRPRDVRPVLLTALRETIPAPNSADTWGLTEDDWQAAYDTYYPPAKRAARHT